MTSDDRNTMSQDTPDKPAPAEPSAGAPAARKPRVSKPKVDKTEAGAPAPTEADAPVAEPATAPVPATAAPEPATAFAAPATPTPAAEPAVEEVTAFTLPAGTVLTTGPSVIARWGAEAAGTFVLVLLGVGAAIYASYFGGVLNAALAYGIAALAAAAAWGNVSGGHFNPAITLGTALAGRTSWVDVLPYWLAQLVGGILAGAVLFITIPSGFATAIGKTKTQEVFAAGANGVGEYSPLATLSSGAVKGTVLQALVIEAIATAILAGVVLAVTSKRARLSFAPVAIGLTLTALTLLTIPLTNGALNPARATAAALFSGGDFLGQLWVFWVAPLVGGAIAGFLYRAFSREPVEDNLLEEDDVAVLDEDLLVVETRTV
ncbi:MIP/aquaporin family protein [Cellulomonas hominis]